MSDHAPIKLRAEDAEDLAVIAACLQDAIASLAEMSFDRPARRFALVVERFLWEEAAGATNHKGLRALRSGLHFEGVSAVRYRGLDRKNPTQVLELLTMMCETVPGAVTISLMFAGGGEIRITADRLRGYLMDLDPPHQTKLRPSHRIEGGNRA
jgi:hypothetical protein